MNKNLNLIQNNFKELPNNIEAEQSVIGSILTQNEIFDEITGIISDKNFFDPLHQKIFSSIQNLIYKGLLANPITLKNYFDGKTIDCSVNLVKGQRVKINTGPFIFKKGTINKMSYNKVVINIDSINIHLILSKSSVVAA